MVEKANAESNLGITLFDMNNYGGNGPNKPATGDSWNEAARFVNYLNTSQGFSIAYKFSTQPRDAGYDPNADIHLWEPADPGYDANNRFRSSLAHHFLPNVYEWYKSAFYDPTAHNGTGGYWDYPTGSELVATPVVGGTVAGTAVWNQSFEQGPADITQVGGLSPYGTMAQAGNVLEWEETEYDLVNTSSSYVRGVRGGGWNSVSSDVLSASFRYNDFAPTNGFTRIIDFRVVSIPEPSDLNFDGSVDAADAGIMFGNWGGSGQGDLNLDGVVDAADAGLVFEKWTGDSAAVPEPSTAYLAALSTLGLLLRRRGANQFPK